MKTVLLIAGGGTLGTYTASELLKLGCQVEVICPEEKVSDHPKLHFHREYATMEFLTRLFQTKHYDGIVDFMNYEEPSVYPPIHALLSANTDHLIFLSSYRVYADARHPITEDAPLLADTVTDKEFLEKEDYAVSKAKLEAFLKSTPKPWNWTVVRPVISFSHRRLDIVTRSRQLVVDCAKSGEPIYLPLQAKDLTAGLDWAGNTGKLIAHLLFKPQTIGQAYTLTSAQGLTWGEVAQLYTKLLGTRFVWVDTQEYIRRYNIKGNGLWMLLYDRLFDRAIDNSKVLRATGLCPEDFTSIEDGIRIELEKLQA